MPIRVAALIPAAGDGRRLRSGGDSGTAPKALRVLAGETILQRSADALAPYVDEIVIAAPAQQLDNLRLRVPGVRLVAVAGGGTRQQSVRSALAAVSDSITWVLVHDAARPLVPADVVRRVLAALAEGAACVVPAIGAPDSLRQVSPDGSSAPLDRSWVRLVQTPQGFTVGALRRAHEAAGTDLATDDASLVEAAGEPVRLVEGDPRAFKITNPVDLALAEALLAQE